MTAPAFRICQKVVLPIPGLLLLFFAVPDRIKWNVLVIGLAWRGWLFFYSLPYLMAAGRRSPQKLG
jgi:hypothetical protein